jgi:hypothetical protein
VANGGSGRTVESTMGFIVAGAPYVPHLFVILTGRNKKSEANPAIVNTAVHLCKMSNKLGEAEASQLALRGEEDLPLNGSVQSFSISDRSERV